MLDKTGVVDRVDLCSEPAFRVGSASVDPVAHEAAYKGSTERLQPQNLKVLVALARKRERVVTREELIDCCWDGRFVGDDVIHRAISTLRQFAGRAGGFSIETVPKAGYRLTETKSRKYWPWIAGAALLVAIAGGLITMWRSSPSADPTRFGAPATPEMVAQENEAIRTLDLKAVERLLDEGWNPNAPLNVDHSTALETLVGNCEWDPGHDRHQMVLIARTLLEAGGRLDMRNIWGDTPYSVARAKRFCGPDHPVTKMFRMYCAEGPAPLGDRCMATYELHRGQHFPDG